MRLFILGLVLVSLLLAGCGGTPPEQNATNETQPPPVVVKTPSFTISTPLANEVMTVPGDTADVSLTLSTQNLVLKKGGAAKKGEGYFKVSVDGQAAASVNAKSYVMLGLALGQHTVNVELVNNDGTSYSPKISKSVTFMLEKAKPAEYVPQSYSVKISSTGYSPSSLTVKVGDSVTFTNEAASPQSATCFLQGKQVFDTNVLATGKSATITMTQQMECEYYSTLFRMMKGTLKVESNGTG